MLVTNEPRAETAALVRAAQAGDRAAFDAIYRQFARMVHGIVLTLVPHSDAEDATHEVFLRAMKYLPSLREPAAFPGWLAAMSRRTAIDYQRSRRPALALVDNVAGGGRPDGEAFEVLDMIQRLPESYRETLVLRLVEGMTGPEIAARTGLTHESVRVNLCRGMKLLRERLERHE